MVMSGALMLECATQLNLKGAQKISCFTVHAILPAGAHEKFVGHPLIKRFWITDTVATTAKVVKGLEPFEVISIAPLVAKYLLGHGSSR